MSENTTWPVCPGPSGGMYLPETTLAKKGESIIRYNIQTPRTWVVAQSIHHAQHGSVLHKANKLPKVFKTGTTPAVLGRDETSQIQRAQPCQRRINAMSPQLS